MATPRVLILGHSFIRRLGEFVDHCSHLDRSFMLSGAAIFRWQGKGGRTLAPIQDDLLVVKSFAPHIVILQLGTNDLSRLDPLLVGSAIEDLVRTLHDSYSVRLVCMCAKPFIEVRTLYLMCESERWRNTLKYFWNHSPIRFSGATGVFGGQPRDSTLVMVYT